MDLTTVTQHVSAFYRLVGTESDDPELTLRGESAGDVAYQFLTRGCRRAQRFMLKAGYGGWRTLSPALTFTEDSITGWQAAALPSNFLRAYGDTRVSALVKTDGTRWGRQCSDIDGATATGDYYWIDSALRIARSARLPDTLYLDHHYRHPVWSASVTINFPEEARALIVAEAANLAKEENWLPGGIEMKAAIDSAVNLAREEAREVARTTKQPMSFRRPRRAGNRW